MTQAIALQLACLGVDARPIFPGIHATYLVHTFQVSDRTWHVLMYSDDIPRVVSDAYLEQSHINLEKGVPSCSS